ncbi:Translin [Kalmanozyma brasiliensis GHG001]|uniref:Translin n=1 Tax=Kalmanozyma brasiliensis (strain GHG001) TaxID=1365824 RepID=V5E8U4_KALBG|nr:Translin [Kalmanozyma brasiliensis GHG001]EST06751.1 Translin [Kalmanozyma brasiliensis GHG001]
MTDLRRERAVSPSAPTRPHPSKRSRSDERSGPTDENQASSSSAKILETFGSFRDEIDAHNDRRERLIKSSRDVTALSKKVIFLLHRFDITDFASAEPSAKTRKLFSEAETKLDEIVALLRQAAMAEGLGSLCAPDQQLNLSAARLRAQRYERNIGGGLEEFIEAISFYHYLRTTQLISLRQIQDRFRTETVSESQLYSKPTETTQPASQSARAGPPTEDSEVLHVPTHRYLLGLSDLTGELMRFATNAVGQGDTGTVIKQVLDLTRRLRDALDPFVPLVKDLKKKQFVTNQSLRKIEDILYAITVRSAEFGSDPKALKEMVRRTLAASSAPNQREDDE